MDSLRFVIFVDRNFKISELNIWGSFLTEFVNFIYFFKFLRDGEKSRFCILEVITRFYYSSIRSKFGDCMLYLSRS
jgi:hypothetical protein